MTESEMAMERAAMVRSGSLDLRSCMRCGFGPDYPSRIPLILVEVPAEERIDVEVTLVTEYRAAGSAVETRRVPGIYAAEYRCKDVAGCDERVAEEDMRQRMAAAPPPEPDPLSAWLSDEEGVGGSDPSGLSSDKDRRRPQVSGRSGSEDSALPAEAMVASTDRTSP